MTGIDPFRHLPEMRDRIVPKAQSAYRDFDLAKLDRMLKEIGDPYGRRSDEEREALRREFLADWPDTDFWVFAYGSLMWDPAFEFDEVRYGEISGYHRSFCLKTMLGRGTVDQPGLMAALDNGGSCQGLVFRVAASILESETRAIWVREMIFPAYLANVVRVDTPQGRVDAMALVVDHNSQHFYPDLSRQERARMIGTGKGRFGTNLAYVENLVKHFDTLGIIDEDLSTLYHEAKQFAESVGS